MNIRKACPTDQNEIAELIYSAGPELYDFIYLTPNKNPLDFIRFEFASGRGFCGYQNVTVVEDAGHVVATGCFFDGRRYPKLLKGTLANMFKFYGPISAWPALMRANHTKSVMHQPRLDELYLSNFGVAPPIRGTGIGTALINSQIEKAKAAGYQKFSLDVADTNPRAEQLYQRLGLDCVQQKQFTGRRSGMSVPNARKMEINLVTRTHSI